MPKAAARLDPTKVLSLTTSIVDIDTLHPNPWNPNRQDDRTYEAERESIREYGFIDPVTVRPHPEAKGIWQIIDGEHRWRAAKDEGYTEILIADLGPIDDVAAKKLTIIFNETRGEADVAAMGRLLAELAEATGGDRDALMTALPFSSSEMEHLLQIGAHDWDAWTAEGHTPRSTRAGDDADPTLREYVVLCSDDEHERIERFAAMLMREGEVSQGAAIADALTEAAKQL